MTNAEKFAKELLKDTELFVKVIKYGLCDCQATCDDCLLHNVGCGVTYNIKNFLESEAKEEELAIWKYDNFPYMKIGKVKYKNADGTVEVKGYDGMRFKPIKIIPYDETLISKFNAILEEHRKAEEEADKRTLYNLRALFGFVNEVEENAQIY